MVIAVLKELAFAASNGALDGTRTHTGAGLSRLPLPLGYEGNSKGIL